MSKTDNEFMTTTEACELLGVSKTVIKRMADTGELDTWKTPGGHRRLKRSSVLKIVEAKFGNSREPEVASKPDSRAVNVLVIDDDPVVSQLFSALLSNIDIPYHLVTANDGYEALIKAGNESFDIIFVDLFMPKLDGYEVVNALKLSDQNKAATIVIITAVSAPEIDHNRLSKEVMVLNKPLNIEVVKQFLRYESRLKSNV